MGERERGYTTGGARSQRSVASQVGQGGPHPDFFDEWKDVALVWINDIDDFVSPDDQYIIRSPYAAHGTPASIFSISNESPCAIVTNAAHGFSTGDRILIVGTDNPTMREPKQRSGNGGNYYDQGGPLNGHVFEITLDGGIPDTKFTLNGLNASEFVGTYSASTGFAIKLTTKTAYDPTTVLDLIHNGDDGLLDDFDTAVNAIDADGDSGDIASAVTRAIDEADTILSTDAIDGVLDAYIQRVDRKYAPRMRSFAAGMCDINAVNGTGFMMGMAYLEEEKRQDIRGFHQKIVLQYEMSRVGLVQSLTSEILSLKKYKTEQMKALVHEQGEFTRMKVAFMSDKSNVDRLLAIKDELWPLDRYQYGINALAMLYGQVGAVPSDEDVVSSGGLGEALSYAAAGAMIGSAIPSVGSAVGAGVGVLISLFD